VLLVFPDHTYKDYPLFTLVNSTGVLALHHLSKQLNDDLREVWRTLPAAAAQRTMWYHPSEADGTAQQLSNDNCADDYFAGTIIASDTKPFIAHVQRMLQMPGSR
jgi:hypothetical protein